MAPKKEVVPAVSALARIRRRWCLYPRGSESVSETNQSGCTQVRPPAHLPPRGGGSNCFCVFVLGVYWFKPAFRVVQSVDAWFLQG